MKNAPTLFQKTWALKSSPVKKDGEENDEVFYPLPWARLLE
jgi:hypothetical protein